MSTKISTQRSPKVGNSAHPPKKGGGRTPKLNPGKVAETLQAKHGNQSEAAAALGVSRTTIAKYVSDHRECAQAILDGRASLVDLAESTLAKEMKAGNVTAAIFVAKTLGKDRGFVERSEHTGAGGGPIEHNIPDVAEALVLLRTAYRAAGS